MGSYPSAHNPADTTRFYYYISVRNSMQRRWYLATLSMIIGESLAGCTGDTASDEPTETPTSTATPTEMPTATPTETPTATPEPTPVPPDSEEAQLKMPFEETWEVPNKEGVTLTATTNVEPGTEFIASLDGKEAPDRSGAAVIFVRSRTEVSEEGRLVWEFDFSDNEDGREFKLTVDNSAQTWEYDGVVVTDE